MPRIGFWLDPTDESPVEVLPDPSDFVDATWDPRERDAVIRYLRAGRVLEEEKGYSWCRFRCSIPDDEMGYKTLTDGRFVWPEGLPHYLEAHAVKPPEEFLEHVRRVLRERSQPRG